MIAKQLSAVENALRESRRRQIFSMFLEIIRDRGAKLLCWQEFRECILYRGFSGGEILDDLVELSNLLPTDEEALKAEDQFQKCRLGWWAGRNVQFSGNIWRHILPSSVNPLETLSVVASEIRSDQRQH